MRHPVLVSFFLFFPLSVVAACAPPFSRDLLDTVDHSLTYRAVRTDPGRYRGTRLLIGGTIITVRNAQEGGLIELLHQPLDRQSRPRATDRSEGRFLAQSDEFLDPVIYHAGREVSLVGEVAGTKTFRLDDIDYTYPVLKVISIHLWQPAAAPRFFFSIGVGHYH